jgi:hypothetical protein
MLQETIITNKQEILKDFKKANKKLNLLKTEDFDIYCNILEKEDLTRDQELNLIESLIKENLVEDNLCVGF